MDIQVAQFLALNQNKVERYSQHLALATVLLSKHDGDLKKAFVDAAIQLNNLHIDLSTGTGIPIPAKHGDALVLVWTPEVGIQIKKNG